MLDRIGKLALVLSVALITGPALAKKPGSPGNSGEHGSSSENASSANTQHDKDDSQDYFNDHRKTVIRNYYSQEGRSGFCPPGLAKKNNGCQPPGQAKKWRKGAPLPHDLIYYDLPAALLRELGRTPEGRKVVQVGSDILLVSAATGVVLDALDLEE